jgi:hypothetical protein
MLKATGMINAIGMLNATGLRVSVFHLADPDLVGDETQWRGLTLRFGIFHPGTRM